MASFLSRLNPTPAFPEYTGPYKVGTVDLEVPVADLPQHSPAPDPNIPTVQFRVFYPCEHSPKHDKHPRWVPQPQHEYIGAYARFLGAGSTFAEVISYFPRLLYYITIPASKNAPVLQPPTASNRWPVMVFSHGLGGTRTAYSHIVGSLASHGIVVVAPEHRDGSAPISIVRHPASSNKGDDLEKPPAGVTSARHSVGYTSLPHTPSKEVENARNAQLRIRIWEVSMIYEALLRLDAGEDLAHLNVEHKSSTKSSFEKALDGFESLLDVHTPGTMSWAGHSFGAATTVQFVKSVFHRPTAANQSDPHFSSYSPLFTPAASSKLIEQITPNTPVVLFDLWALPIRGNSTRWLWDRPLPCYSKDGPGGTRLLAILSEAFFKWNGNLKDTKRIISENPSVDGHRPTKATARIFYPKTSAHLSQSDFGILFPWLTKKVFRADDPERTLRLNVRASLQILRNAGIEVAATSRADMEVAEIDKALNLSDKERLGDWKILATDGSVEGWVAVSPNVEEAERESTEENMDTTKDPAEAVLDEEVLGGKRGQIKAQQGVMV